MNPHASVDAGAPDTHKTSQIPRGPSGMSGGLTVHTSSIIGFFQELFQDLFVSFGMGLLGRGQGPGTATAVHSVGVKNRNLRMSNGRMGVSNEQLIKVNV